MACTELFDTAVSDETIEKVRDCLGMSAISLDSCDAPVVVRWLRSDEASGKFVVSNHYWLFTDPTTAMAFKLRFG